MLASFMFEESLALFVVKKVTSSENNIMFVARSYFVIIDASTRALCGGLVMKAYPRLLWETIVRSPSAYAVVTNAQRLVRPRNNHYIRI